MKKPSGSYRWKKVLCGLLSAAVLTAGAAAVPSPEDESPVLRSYTGQFTDVAYDAWYYNDVANAYSLGLIDGVSADSFHPNGSLTIAQTIKLAAICHLSLSVTGKVNAEVFGSTGGSWYAGYVSYAKEHDIVTEEYPDYDAPATRAQVAVLFARAILHSGAQPAEKNALTAGVLNDVDASSWYASSVYRLYRWGIMTGDEHALFHPANTIRRSEICAVVMRTVGSSYRVTAASPSDSGSSSESAGSSESVSYSGAGSLILYEGSSAARQSSDLSGFAAELSVSNGTASPNVMKNLTFVSHLMLEPDCLSFRLYRGAGYEAFSTVRTLLNGTARGVDGTVQRGANETYSELNRLFYLWINGSRLPVTELWYTDHGSYITYALYFGRTLDLSGVTDVKLSCGSLTSYDLLNAGLSSLSDLVANAGAPVSLSDILAGHYDGSGSSGDSGDYDAGSYESGSYGSESSDSGYSSGSTYADAIARVKAGAISIIFEYENDRADIVYGQGVNGCGAGNYRLMLVFRDGSTQTIADRVLNSIHLSATGDIVYYSMTGPDGQNLQYAVNLDN